MNERTIKDILQRLDSLETSAVRYRNAADGSPLLVWQGSRMAIGTGTGTETDPLSVHVGAAAGGVLSGTYPNPGFAVDMATQAELNAIGTGPFQPLDSDLTALAGITAGAMGFDLLTSVDDIDARSKLNLSIISTLNVGTGLQWDIAGATLRIGTGAAGAGLIGGGGVALAVNTGLMGATCMKVIGDAIAVDVPTVLAQLALGTLAMMGMGAGLQDDGSGNLMIAPSLAGDGLLVQSAGVIKVGAGTGISIGTDTVGVIFGTGSGQVTQGNDTRIPTQSENDALTGTYGAPGTGNRYATDADPRMNATEILLPDAIKSLNSTAVPLGLYWNMASLTDQSGHGRNGTAQGGLSVGGSGAITSDGGASTDFAGGYVTSSYAAFPAGSIRTVVMFLVRDTDTTADAMFGSDGGDALSTPGAGLDTEKHISLGQGGTGYNVSNATVPTAAMVPMAVVMDRSNSTSEAFMYGSSQGLKAMPYVSGVKSPGTVVDDSSFGTVAWSNPGNATASDNVYATATPSIGATTHYLKATNFGFAIPSGATISGITVEIEKTEPGLNLTVDARVRIVKGGAIGATDRSVPGNWPGYMTGPVVEGYVTHGGSSDLWGETWTAADINDSTFGVAIAATESYVYTGNGTPKIDHIRITVNYTMASPPSPGNFELGTRGNDHVDLFDGKIAHLAIYEGRLSEASIRWLANVGLGRMARRDWGVVQRLPTVAEGVTYGDRATYIADDAGGAAWEFVYDGQGTYPWKCVGGSPRHAMEDTQRQTASTSYVSFTLALNAPLAGDYDISISAMLTPNPSISDQNFLSYAVGGTAASDAWSLRAFSLTVGTKSHRHLGVGAASTVVEKAKVSFGNTGSFANRHLWLMPVRVQA